MERLIDTTPWVLELPESFSDVIRYSDTATIVQGDRYHYFCLANSFEPVSISQIYTSVYLHVFELKNFKEQTIGYLLYEVRSPSDRRAADLGVTLFWSKARSVKSHSSVDVVCSDTKFRLVRFGTKDFFAAVKWKSYNPEAEAE